MRMKALLSPPLRALLAALLSVNLLYLAATAYSLHIGRAIDTHATDIAFDVTVRIERLADARGELRRLETLIDHQVDRVAAARPPNLAVIDGARRQLRHEVTAYLAMPAGCDEPSCRELAAALPSLDATVGRVAARLAAGDEGGARELVGGALRGATAHLSGVIQRAINDNARLARELATEIQTARRRSRRIAAALDVLSILVSAVIGLVAARAIHRFDALREERANELENFAGRVAHDIKTPLAAVGMSLRLAAHRADDASRRDALARGQSSLDRAVRIIDGLLEFARSGARPSADASASARAVIDDVVSGLQPLADEAGVALRVEPFGDVTVACGPGVLTSMLSNLIHNAIKYLGDPPVRRITLRLLDRGRTARFEVEDTGPGVPPEIRSTVFEPHIRAPGLKQPGIGLGLATVRRLARAHGGEVGLEPARGSGSCFWFELPTRTRAG